MRLKSLNCHNRTGSSLRRHPVTLGVPLAAGELFGAVPLCLSGSDGRRLPVQGAPLAHWPDGSAKWLLLDFLLDLPPETTETLSLGISDTILPAGTLVIREEPQRLHVDTGDAIFTLDAGQFRPLLSVAIPEPEKHRALTGELVCVDGSGKRLRAMVQRMSVETPGPVRCTVLCSGVLTDDRCDLLAFEARLHCYAASAKAKMELRLHNPRAALHPRGLWDLGDPGSLLLRELTVQCSFDDEGETPCLLRPEEGQPWLAVIPGQETVLYQESSGGVNWGSPTHVNSGGRLPLTFRGYRLMVNGALTAEGERAQPFLWRGAEDRGFTATIGHFWQKFPKAVRLTRGAITLGLLPGEFPDAHEIQAGEQMTNTLFLDFSATRHEAPFGSNGGIEVGWDRQVYQEARVFKELAWTHRHGPYHVLLDLALDPAMGFFAKRERIDEYGWRHFGDLYADHEAAFHKDEELFISHYNNQYDTLFGFYRQFFREGDPRWAQLAEDLAAHVADIDIYHTTEDREEYNGGPFWHTDHYLDAATSSHRMSSKAHLLKKDPRFCGGGPDSEHCYTTGLMVHHFHTGDPRFRDLVPRLADWCYLSLRGPQTVMAALLRGARALRACRGNREGKPLFHRFPLSRATGNCIKASLDAFELTRDRAYLSRAAHLIRNTVHPLDPLAERNLGDPETTWFYTVFLSAVALFLHTKEELGERDDDYGYALLSFLHYLRWMAEHEYPYLERPELLEFPNETWAGQDLRKAVLFYHATHYVGPEEKEVFRERCRFFLEKSFVELGRWESRSCTRPLALVLQNGWVADKLEEESATPAAGMGSPAAPSLSEPPRLTLSAVFRRIASELSEILPATSVRREYRWFAARFLQKSD